MPRFSKPRKAMLLITAILAVKPWPTAAQTVVCVNCGSEFTQLLNYAMLVEQYLKQAAILQQTIAQYKNMVANSQALTNQQWSSALADLRAVTAIFASAKSVSYASANLDQQFSARYGTYDSYVSAKSNGQTMAAKYKQWSEDVNASTKAALKAAGLQSSQIEGSEEAYIQTLEAQATTVKGRLDAIQTGNQIAVEEVRQIQKLRQLLFANLQLQASFVQTGQDQAAVKQANEAKYFKWTDVPENNGKNY
jgi:P-type conjugative transfer protein TrbJ